MNIIWLLCALLPIQSVSQRVMPKYALTPGAKCPTSYQPLTSGWKQCKTAAESLGFSGDSVAHVEWNWNNTGIWASNRPQGCFRSTGNGRFHYNSGAGGRFSGSDKILCVKKVEDLTDEHLHFDIRGSSGTEIINIYVGSTKTVFNVKKQLHHFTFPKPATAKFTVEFVNDAGDRDVWMSGFESQVTDTLPEFRMTGEWNCDTQNENIRCDYLREGRIAWNGRYTWHLKGEVAYSHNCNCGARLANFAPNAGKDTIQLCRNACEANPSCKSFGLWTKESISAGHCALFDKPCVPTCPTPTSVETGYFNDVFNRNADETSENNVITWLRKLIAEGLNEIDDINNKVNISAKALKAAESRFSDAEVKEAEARTKHDIALEELNVIKGKCTARQNAYNRAAPALKEEIETFDKVISSLQDLLSGGKALVEENKVEIASFISLADQADPTKVEKVITLVQGLRTASQKQLNDLANEVKLCQTELANKAKEFADLLAAWKSAVTHLGTREKELDVVIGKHDTIVQYANHRIQIVSREVDDLRAVIELLSTLL